MEGRTVRALYEAVSSPENECAAYDEGRMKILFPALEPVTLNTEVDNATSPFPIILFLVGAFVEANRYQWLGERIVRETGAVFVLFDAFSNFRSTVLLGPLIGGSVDGVPPTFKLSWVLAKLEELNAADTLKGHLDLNRIILGGHSFGARAATDTFAMEPLPNVVGIFLFGAHPLSLVILNDTESSIRSVQELRPLLLVNGRRDALVFSSAGRITGMQRPPPIEAILNATGTSSLPYSPFVYVEMEGLNHFAIVDPEDTTTMGSGFIDFESEVDKSVAKDRVFTVFSAFIRTLIANDTSAATAWNNTLEVGNLGISEVLVVN